MIVCGRSILFSNSGCRRVAQNVATCELLSCVKCCGTFSDLCQKKHSVRVMCKEVSRLESFSLFSNFFMTRAMTRATQLSDVSLSSERPTNDICKLLGCIPQPTTLIQLIISRDAAIGCRTADMDSRRITPDLQPTNMRVIMFNSLTRESQ